MGKRVRKHIDINAHRNNTHTHIHIQKYKNTIHTYTHTHLFTNSRHIAFFCSPSGSLETLLEHTTVAHTQTHTHTHTCMDTYASTHLQITRLVTN